MTGSIFGEKKKKKIVWGKILTANNSEAGSFFFVDRQVRIILLERDEIMLTCRAFVTTSYIRFTIQCVSLDFPQFRFTVLSLK